MAHMPTEKAATSRRTEGTVQQHGERQVQRSAPRRWVTRACDCACPTRHRWWHVPVAWHRGWVHKLERTPDQGVPFHPYPRPHSPPPPPLPPPSPPSTEPSLFLPLLRVCTLARVLRCGHRLVGLVVRRPPRERMIPGSNPACDGISFRVESYQ